MTEGYTLAFGPEARAGLASGRLTLNGAAFLDAVCRRCPTSLREVITALGIHGVTEDEVRAGCAEALLAGVVRTDGHEFRPGDAAFFWPVRRASD